MKTLLCFLTIFLLPLLMNAQEVILTVNKDTTTLRKNTVNIIDGVIDKPFKNSVPNNIIKIAGFLVFGPESGVGIVSLGYERRINEHYSYELVGSICSDNAFNKTDVYSIRPGVKYYYTENHIPYVSLFFRYQQNKYNNEDPSGQFSKVKGFGLGVMMGTVLDISRIVKFDIGFGIFYSYRTPIPPKSDDNYFFVRGLYLLPRIHLGFCF